MAITIVQQTTQKSASSTSPITTSAFPSPPTAGNAVLVFIMGDIISGSTTLKVTDSAGKGNAYNWQYLYSYSVGLVTSNPALTGVTSNPYVGVWACWNIGTTSSFTITLTGNGSTSIIANIVAMEISGLSPNFDGTANNSGTSATSVSTGTFSTLNANDLIILGFTCQGSSPTYTAPSGFTDFNTQTGSNLTGPGTFAYQIVTSTQSSIDPTWTTTGLTEWGAIAMALEAGSAGLEGAGGFGYSLNNPATHQPAQVPWG